MESAKTMSQNDSSSPDELEARLDHLEEVVKRQQETIEKQQEQIKRQEETENNGDGSVVSRFSRRSLLHAAGIIGLAGYGTGVAAADPQGQVGTASDPLHTLYTQELNGGVTGDEPVTSLLGTGLSVDDESLSAADAAADHVDIADSGSSVVDDASIINFAANLSVSNPTGSQVDVDASGAVAWTDSNTSNNLLEPTATPRGMEFDQLGFDPNVTNDMGALYASDGTATGNAGDVVVGADSGGTTRQTVLFDHTNDGIPGGSLLSASVTKTEIDTATDPSWSATHTFTGNPGIQANGGISTSIGTLDLTTGDASNITAAHTFEAQDGIDVSSGTIELGANTVIRETDAEVTEIVNNTAPISLAELATSKINSVERITEAADLPTPSNGVHPLADSTAYFFDDFVTSSDALELGSRSVLVATHGGLGGFIYTGGSGAAIRGSGVPFFARDMLISAPGATTLDLTADNTTEMLVESCSFADPSGLGNMASLGTIDGYRVPSFKGCNFEDFDSGLTFDGNPDKVFISESPARSVTASNVSIFTLAGTIDIDIVDFPDNYVKGVQSDTEVWRIEAGGEPNEVFQYRGVTHDTTVNKTNIIVGPNASPRVEPFWVNASYPLRDSGVTGAMYNDGSGTVTISAVDTYTKIDIASIIENVERLERASDGEMRYLGSKDTVASVTLNASFYGSNGDIYTFGLAKNGTVAPRHESSVEANGRNANVTIPVNAVLNLTTNDTASIQVKNESNDNDLTILGYTFSITGD